MDKAGWCEKRERAHGGLAEGMVLDRGLMVGICSEAGDSPSVEEITLLRLERRVERVGSQREAVRESSHSQAALGVRWCCAPRNVHSTFMFSFRFETAWFGHVRIEYYCDRKSLM